MMLTCVECRKTFTRDDSVTVHLSDDGMYFFCTTDCKRNWLYPLEPEIDLEVTRRPLT